MTSPIVQVTFQRLPSNPHLPLPRYANLGDAGMDVVACETGTIDPGQRRLVKTGLRVSIPLGYEIQVRSRSGLALKHGVVVFNSPGTIDCGYRGEIGVILFNASGEQFFFEKGDRIAQLVVAPVCMGAVLETTEDLSETERGEGGFGSSGRA